MMLCRGVQLDYLNVIYTKLEHESCYSDASVQLIDDFRVFRHMCSVIGINFLSLLIFMNAIKAYIKVTTSFSYSAIHLADIFKEG